MEKKDKVSIGDVFTFRDYRVAKYGKLKVIDGEEYTAFKHIYKTFHIRILDTEGNRMLFDKHKYTDSFGKNRKVRKEDNYMVEVISDLPFVEYAGPGAIRNLGFPGKAILSKEEMVKYLDEEKLAITCGDNCSCYPIGPEIFEFAEEMKEYDRKNGVND